MDVLKTALQINKIVEECLRDWEPVPGALRRQPEVSELHSPPLGVWDFSQLRAAMTAQAITGRYPSGTPEIIRLGPLRGHLDILTKASRERGVECGRAGFIDLGGPRLVLGEAHAGTRTSVSIPLRAPLGRSPVECSPALLIHTHPEDDAEGLHFSGTDYKSLLGEPRLMVSIVAHGPATLMVMKTSFTPERVEEKCLERRIQIIDKDFLRGKRASFDAVIAFTKQVAVEYGLSLYVGNRRDTSVLEKIPVEHNR